MERKIVATDHYISKEVILLEMEEFAELVPPIEKVVMKKINELRKKVEYYEGIKEQGATNKQLDKWFSYTEKLEFFETIKTFIDKTKRIK
jgi:hypothetical protein